MRSSYQQWLGAHPCSLSKRGASGLRLQSTYVNSKRIREYVFEIRTKKNFQQPCILKVNIVLYFKRKITAFILWGRYVPQPFAAEGPICPLPPDCRAVTQSGAGISFSVLQDCIPVMVHTACTHTPQTMLQPPHLPPSSTMPPHRQVWLRAVIS